MDERSTGAPVGDAPGPVRVKVVVWTRLEGAGGVSAALWDLCTDPGELATLMPPWLRWELSHPEGLKAALRGVGEVDASRVHVTRLRVGLLGGRRLGLPLQVRWTEPGLRYAVGAEAAWARPFELRVRLERALTGPNGPRVRLVHELVFGLPEVAWRAPGSRLALRVAAGVAQRALTALHRGVVRQLGQDAEPAGRVFLLPPAMAGHAEDPLGTDAAPGEAPHG